MAFLSNEVERSQLGAAERLLKSEIYGSRLRRALINGWDPRVLTDFLVLDDITQAILWPFMGSDEWRTLVEMRGEAFSKALESALRKLDVRIHDQGERLHAFLLARRDGVMAEQVMDAVYGPPKKGRVY